MPSRIVGFTVQAGLSALLVLLAFAPEASAQVLRRTSTTMNRTYIYIPGKFTQQQAWAQAKLYGGHPIVFSHKTEWDLVQSYFPFKLTAPYHTGHYQLSKSPEPAGGWKTTTGEPGYWSWNGKGPDDGCKNRVNFVSVGDGSIQITYGPSCKNEDAAVVWIDSYGQFEDVSINHPAGVLLEVPLK
jgi:hypothetical protein